MQDFLIVVDMQNDFITGPLGSKEAMEILPNVEKIVKEFKGKIVFTKDTHEKNYLSTQEGKNLPVEHCIKGTQGWEIADSLLPYATKVIEKPTFGSLDLLEYLKEENAKEKIGKITLVGVCTDICVISNAMIIKSAFLDAEIEVVSSACAGASPQSHINALGAMQMCQITIS